jgi:hypothetical protein
VYPADELPGVRDLLIAQTGRLDWQELERAFARGVVIRVATELDLVEVAAAVVEDDSVRLAGWLEERLVAKATTAEARGWQATRGQFWAVVCAPWVLVQEAEPRDGDQGRG